MKGNDNDNDGWSSDGVVLWLVRKQIGVTDKCWEEWPMLRCPFYSSGGWKSSGSGSGRRRWCRFKTLVSAREGRRRDEVLSEDEAEVANLSWLYGKEA
jgi:hypothetical protein